MQIESTSKDSTRQSLKKHQTEQQTKIDQMRKNYEKRVHDKWRKALKYLGINENLFPNHLPDLMNFEPFNENTIAKVRQGHFDKKPLDRIVLEIVNFEVVNGCFHAKLRDINGDEIQGTFHTDCKEVIKTNRCRKGSVIVLKKVAAFAISSSRYYFVMMATCIEQIF